MAYLCEATIETNTHFQKTLTLNHFPKETGEILLRERSANPHTQTHPSAKYKQGPLTLLDGGRAE